jgi:hypothetical protein
MVLALKSGVTSRVAVTQFQVAATLIRDNFNLLLTTAVTAAAILLLD